ncbi:CHAD domain-containing protein [Devosia sp. YR412]|uniref:CHAD domain-containing protein n=1 Tax=Devosia sp. YR412 TaxID=1881030 RepID=UPI0008AC7DDE|nr:CHAD domain-containing protein [Devosia sp. YR412]SEP96606.1 CHAD domain-containing protein [Devosia sp. YR412]
MSFAFKTSKRVTQQVREIAAEQVSKALTAVEAGDADFDATVHALRRRCKKLRGLLRLVEPHFEGFTKENAAIRDAADLLGGARDARVMVETLDGLVAGRHAAAEQAIGARQYLVDRVESLSNGGDRAETLEQFAKMFGQIAKRIDHWQFDASGYVVISDGLERTYKQFCKGVAEAHKHDTAEALHVWRKQAKYHGYHVTLLGKTAPDILEPRGKSLVRLGDLLGDHHNLAVLGDTLADEAGRLGDVSEIERSIVARQHELAADAFALGQQLAAEAPSALRQRFAAYWQLLPEEN